MALSGGKLGSCCGPWLFSAAIAAEAEPANARTIAKFRRQFKLMMVPFTLP
jgi:hypothetical protein